MTVTPVLPSFQQALPAAFSQPALWRVMPMGGDAHGVAIRLNNGHQLQIDEASSQVRIINTEAQPPVTTTLPDDLSGRTGSGSDLSGPLRFMLNDGTKITLQVSPGANGAGPRIEGLVVTRDEQSLIVDGLGSRRGGDLRCLPGLNGQALDRLLGNSMPTVRETAQGSGWTPDRAGCAPISTAGAGTACASGPSLPDLRRQLQSLYCGSCEPATQPVHGKHGYGKHGIGGAGYGKHGCDVHAGKHGYGKHGIGGHGYGKHGISGSDCGTSPVYHGKHGASVHHGKHGGSTYLGKHGCESVPVYPGCGPIPVHHGKHGVSGGHGKHGAYGKHGVGC